MLRNLLLSAATLTALTSPLRAASDYAGEFLALGAGARALALGSAYVAIADDATAGYWNPAGLADLDGRQVHLTHAERYSGLVAHDYVAVARSGRRVRGMALSLVRVGVDDIPFTELQDPGRALGPDNRPVVSTTATSSDYALYFSAGHRPCKRLSVGASLKVIYRSVGSFSAYGFGLDLGLRYRLGPGISLAASFRDVTTTPVFWDTDTADRIQPSALFGVAYSLPLAGGRATAVLASRTGGDAADASGDPRLNAGLEYWYRHLAVRAGFEDGRQAFGVGLRPHQRLDLDLAYLQHDELEATYQVSAGFRF